MRSPIPRTAGQRLSQSCLLLWKFCLSTFWRPLNASQFLWQLLWVNRVNERHVGLGLCAGQKFKFLRPTHDEPEHVGFGIVEHLTQLVWPNEHPAMLRHSQCLVAHTDSPHSFQDEIEFFCPDMLVERVGAIRWQPPKPCSKILALGSLQKSAFGIFIISERRQWRSSGVIKKKPSIAFIVVFLGEQ